MNSDHVKALFLHGGPGLHAAVEREWFGDSLPVHWWDQPAVDASSPFHTLVSHAAHELHALADASGGPIELIAHSYGAHLAVALVRECPEMIRRITLLGAMSTTPCRPFLHLGRRLLETHHDRPGLLEAMAAVEEFPDADRFTTLIQTCFPEPTLPGIYFAPDSIAARERYLALAKTAPPIDVPAFFSVMLESLQNPRPDRVADFPGEVRVLLGKHDPVLCVDDSTKAWRTIFPRARFEVVDAGHFLHLELPVNAWLGR